MRNTIYPVYREEYELLEAVQERLVVHQLTAPVLGNDHNEFRRREIRVSTSLQFIIMWWFIFISIFLLE